MEEKTYYAVKILKKDFSVSQLRAFMTEVDILSRLNDRTSKVPKIVDVNFQGDYHKPGNQPFKVSYYVMELIEYGELFNLVREEAPLTEDCLRLLFRRLVSAVIEVHSAQVFHRDIKCENVLLDKDLQLRLCDFGSSIDISSTLTGEMANLHRRRVGDTFGTSAYSAPEVHKALDVPKQFDKIEVFSLGCTLFLLVSLLDSRPSRNIPSKKPKERI